MRKKFLKGVTTFGVASAICMAMGITASAAELKVNDNVWIDTESQTLVVEEAVANTGDDENKDDENSQVNPTAEGDEEGDEDQKPEEGDQKPATTVVDREILVSVSSVKSGKIKASSWDVYPMETVGSVKLVTVDLSSLNTTKDNYIQVKGDRNDEVVTIKIPATDKKVKPKYDATTDTVKAEGSTLPLEYRTQYGSWEPYDAKDTDLKLYQQRGATLYFRLASYKATNKTETLNDATKNSTKTFKAVELESLPGKEVKVKIAKMANAPKATVSYTKNTVTLPKGAKYTVFADNEEIPKDETWKGGASAQKGTIDDASMKKILEDGADLELRTAKTGKADSKIAHYAFSAQNALYGMAQIPATEEGKAPSADNVEKATISETDGVTDKSKTVSATIKEIKKKNSSTYNLEIANKTEDKYEVVYDGAEPTAATKGIKSIKSGATLTLKNVAKDKLVWIRRAGDQKAAKWATPWVTMGKVVIPEKADDNNGDETKEPTVKELLDLLIDQLVESEVSLPKSPANTVVPLAKTGQTITWNQEATYTESSKNKTMEGVKATVVASEENNYVGVDYENEEVCPVWLTTKTNLSSFKGATETVTVTLTKGDVTSTKEVTINLLAE